MIALADIEGLGEEGRGRGGEGVQHSLQRLNDDHKHKHTSHLPMSQQKIPAHPRWEMIWIPSPPPYPAYAPKQCLPCPSPPLSLNSCYTLRTRAFRRSKRHCTQYSTETKHFLLHQSPHSRLCG
ncbi:hypothetical protein L207DRAFT_518028 [Hyaloscypha variabilis F]|uniref:Uncharacterized protein n=1 Tax=Hyaloscypha variabilis (strain UAMH 11265 / GT02V1 / F) TaxID=1149755 RepID=A0A2J6R3U0_HYAVF|nr:hypothetical protein L207DRAFT_518028 [Hyaloscypha variabilis F]